MDENGSNPWYIRNRSSPWFRVWLRPERNLRKQDYWSDVMPRGSLLRMSNSG